MAMTKDPLFLQGHPHPDEHDVGITDQSRQRFIDALVTVSVCPMPLDRRESRPHVELSSVRRGRGSPYCNHTKIVRLWQQCVEPIGAANPILHGGSS